MAYVSLKMCVFRVNLVSLENLHGPGDRRVLWRGQGPDGGKECFEKPELEPRLGTLVPISSAAISMMDIG